MADGARRPAGRRLASAARRAWREFRAAAANEVSPSRFSISLDYEVRPEPRWGHGKPVHPQLQYIIARNAHAYADLLQRFGTYADDLLKIPLDAPDATSPAWHNTYMTGLDAVALYCMLALGNPARYLEVGSGHSTRFARRAIADHKLRTTITSIDPEPRAEIDALCDRVVRTPLERADPAPFDELESGDIVFFDGSHRSFANSDATVALIEVFPRLKPGVLVEVHDVTLPWDYPSVFCDAYYSEQYLLAAYLLADGPTFEIVLPNFFVTLTPELHHILDPVWDRFAWSATATNGLSFWMRKT